MNYILCIYYFVHYKGWYNLEILLLMKLFNDVSYTTVLNNQQGNVSKSLWFYCIWMRVLR
jgi:hypothetical protein